jgi:arylsulfatase A-like enzyme
LTGQPNVVFVITDDQGYGDLGCHGNPVLRTPHIDRFYEESVRFTNFHVGPTCAPTRAGLLTGHYANSTGVWHTIGGRSLLRKDEWTLAAALRESGYRTGIFGKWHLGDTVPYRPQDRGFETAIVHGGGGISQTPDYWGNDYYDDTYFVNGEPQHFKGYCTDVFFREAMRFIEANRDRPFFCYIPTNAPHEPLNIHPPYATMYSGQVEEHRGRFYGMISNIDDNFGQLRSKLQELGLEDNTILIFMTDNGTAGGAKTDSMGFVTEGYNAGLRGLKSFQYDGGHRVPFFIRWPGGGVSGGHEIGRIAANVDFMPTILDLCGAAVPAERTFHGMSLRPLLEQSVEAAEWPDRVMVTDSQRLARPVKWRKSAVMSDRWRLIDGTDLYDADNDREQRFDIAAAHPDVVEKLRHEYEVWWDIVSVQFENEIPLLIGHEETVLTAHDWRNEDCSSPWNQKFIRAGQISNGYWEIEVGQPGEYEVELRRWPREANRPLAAGIDGDDIQWSRDMVEVRSFAFYTDGVKLDIERAVLRIGGIRAERDILPDDVCASFRVALSEGPAHLQTWLTGSGGLELGAYYVYIRLISG